jgi:Zn-dependent protease with chaperone function
VAAREKAIRVIDKLRELRLAQARRVGTAHRQHHGSSAAAIASLFIVDPLPNTWLGRLFSSHPTIERRIQRLRGMAVKGFPQP